MKKRTAHLPWIALLAALPLITGAGAAAPPDAQRHFTLEGQELVLANLIGQIRVEGASGSTFEIDVSVEGDEAAVSRIQFDAKGGESANFYVQYPFPDETRFVYPAMGQSSNTTFNVHSVRAGKERWAEWVLPKHHGGKIEIHGDGRGTRVWADVTVKVPDGKRIEVRHGVGRIDAEGVKGGLLLDSHSGSIGARGITGDVVIDTGSGAVTLADIRGDLSVDTGSGAVEAADCSGDQISIDTGSGSVNVEKIDCKVLEIDTGSGSVDAMAIRVDGARIDTGSGAIGLALERMGAGPYRLDTGSGGIELQLPQDASARVSADTGSGRIRLDVTNARVHRLEKTEVELVLGDGTAKVALDTGSGSITIRQ
jgi:hypothetical protein